MTDISKKKEEAKRGIRAVLISAPLGLTFKELKNDYLDLIGSPLPGTNIGYNSFEDFVKDIPDVVQIQYEGSSMVLRAVADLTTKHIEKMVSKQKIDSKKKMKVNAKRQSDAMRSTGKFMPPPRQIRPTAPRFYKPPSQRVYNNNNNSWSGGTRGGGGGHMNRQADGGQRNFHNNNGSNQYNTGNYNQHNQNRMSNAAPRHHYQQQAHHRTVPCIPAHIQRDIHNLVSEHQEGLPLTHFSRIFRVRYQIHLDPYKLGFQDEYELLASLPDIVALKRFQQGEMRVLPVGTPGDGRPQTDLPPLMANENNGYNSNNKKAYSSSSSPPQQKSSGDGRGRHSPKSHEGEDDWNKIMYKDACNNIPEYIQMRLEKMFSTMPEGIKASCLLSEYKKIYKIDLPIKSYGYNSAIEFVSDLSHIIRSERPNKFDWVLYPVKTPQGGSSSCPPNKTQAMNSARKSDADGGKSNEKKTSSTLVSQSSTHLASHKVEWEVKEAITQVLSLNPNGIPLDRFVNTYEEMTGSYLNVQQYGVDSVKGFLHSLKDILYIMLDEEDQPVVCLTNEGGPRKFDFLRDKYKPITPAPKPLLSTPESLGGATQPQQQRQQSVFPPQAVTPGCHYKPQAVTYIDTGSNGNYQQNYIAVYVSFTTHPGHFWVQLRGLHTTIALEDLMDALEECYGNPTNGSHVNKAREYRMSQEIAQPGMVCAVIYPEDLYWHRGLITGSKDNLYEVFFVDYGNTCYISLENMRLLKTKFFTLPAQAIRARLSNVEPIKKTWSVRARQRFLDLTRERPLLGFVTAFKHRILSLCLTDTEGQDDIHINDLMTYEGYAQFKPDTDEIMELEDKHTCTMVLTNDFLYGKQSLEDGRTTSTGTQGVEDSSVLGRAQTVAGGGDHDDGTPWRRYVRQAQMSDDHLFNLIFLGGKDLYLMSSEISFLFFQEDIISAKLRSDKTSIPKVVVTKEEYPDLYKELLSLPLMMEMYGQDKNLGDIKDIVLTILDWFDPNDPYWKGEDDQSDEDDEEDSATVDSQSVVSDSKESFKMDDLRMVLDLLQTRRTRSLRRLLDGADAKNKEDEVNALNQVEIDIRRVEALIESFEKKASSQETKQTASQSINNTTANASSSTSLTAPFHRQLSKGSASSNSSSSQQQRQQPTSVIPPVTVTVAPTPKLTSSSATTTAASSSLPSSMLAAGYGGLGGMTTSGAGGGGGMAFGGLGRGFGMASGLPTIGGLAGGPSSMDMGEMLRQQVNMNSLLMSQMGMMNTTPMMPSLPLSMEQMQQQQALLQQQMLLQQQQQQQQQQQLLQCQQQQQNLQLGAMFPTSASPPSPQVAPGFSGFNPMRGQLLSKINGSSNAATAAPSSASSSTTSSIVPPPQGTANTNMFCASLGRVLSSALNDENKSPNTGMTFDLSKMNLNKR